MYWRTCSSSNPTAETGTNCAGCFRADNDYAVSWLRGYEKGWIFYSSLGHNPNFFWTLQMLQFFLSAIQFDLGDLADTTPSAKLAVR